MRYKAVVAVAAVAALVGVGAAGASPPAGGKFAIFATPSNGPTSKIVFAGAIGDYGTATSIDKNGKVDNNGNYVRIKLKNGTFEVDSTVLNKKTDNAPPMMVNKTTCSAEFGGTGPVTLFDGTGAYAGISGKAQITLLFLPVGPRYRSGAKKGKCDFRESTPPAAFTGSISGAGTVTFG